MNFEKKNLEIWSCFKQLIKSANAIILKSIFETLKRWFILFDQGKNKKCIRTKPYSFDPLSSRVRYLHPDGCTTSTYTAGRVGLGQVRFGNCEF